MVGDFQRRYYCFPVKETLGDVIFLDAYPVLGMLTPTFTTVPVHLSKAIQDCVRSYVMRLYGWQNR